MHKDLAAYPVLWSLFISRWLAKDLLPAGLLLSQPLLPTLPSWPGMKGWCMPHRDLLPTPKPETPLPCPFGVWDGVVHRRARGSENFLKTEYGSPHNRTHASRTLQNEMVNAWHTSLVEVKRCPAGNCAHTCCPTIPPLAPIHFSSNPRWPSNLTPGNQTPSLPTPLSAGLTPSKLQAFPPAFSRHDQWNPMHR